MRVLWIEDQVQENEEYFEVLESHGESIVLAGRLDEAIRALDEEEFDLVVVDLLIPLGDSPSVSDYEDTKYNGLYVLQLLETRGLLGKIRTICLTHFPQAAERFVGDPNVQIVRKIGYLRDFEKLIYD